MITDIRTDVDYEEVVERLAELANAQVMSIQAEEKKWLVMLSAAYMEIRDAA